MVVRVPCALPVEAEEIFHVGEGRPTCEGNGSTGI